uniref:RAP domain-containing protein n=2 Tax=Babesia bovis TaxID=5865 RepID=A7AUH0_BABBO|eukprot:XP_001610149.1 hypothetical protein [Babesia bovis T2Bo]
MAGVRVGLSAPIERVKSTLSESAGDINSFCQAVSRCSLNPSHRYVLYTVDSVYEGLELDSSSTPGNAAHKNVTRHLFKLPRAVYIPRAPEGYKFGPDFGSLLDSRLDASTLTLQDMSTIVNNIIDMCEFIAEHSLDTLVGPLRPSVLSFLEAYRERLLADRRYGEVKRLRFATELLHVTKLHSIDCDDLVSYISNMLGSSPGLLRQSTPDTLEYLCRMKLPYDLRCRIDGLFRSLSCTHLSVDQWSHLFAVACRANDNRNTVDCFIQQFKVLYRGLRVEADHNRVSQGAIMHVVRGISNLRCRICPSDPLWSNVSHVIESLWPFVNVRKGRFSNSEFIAVAECYFHGHRSLHPQLSQGARDCLDILIREFHRRRGSFLLRDWVNVFEVLEHARDAMAVNVLMNKGSSYYIPVSTIQRAWVEDVSAQLSEMPLESLADSVYSLSFPQCSNLCRHLVHAGCYAEPLSAALERRCLALLTDLKYHTTRHVLDLYFFQLQMVLPPHNPLRSALQSNKTATEMVSGISSYNLIRLLSLSLGTNASGVMLILNQLCERIESNLLSLGFAESCNLLSHAVSYQHWALVNAILSVAVPRVLRSHEGHKCLSRLLDLSKFTFSMPDSGSISTPATVLQSLVLERAANNVHHLGLPHLDLLLRNLSHCKFTDCTGQSADSQQLSPHVKSLLESALSHAMEIDLCGYTANHFASMVEALAQLGIRHDMLLDRLVSSCVASLVEADISVAATSLTSLASSLARVDHRVQALGDFFERILDLAPVPISNWDFEALDMQQRMALLHSISLYGIVTESLEARFLEVVAECERLVSNSATSGISACTYRQMYDTYISLLVAGMPNMGVSGRYPVFLLEHLPCYHWFKHQETKLADFKVSGLYTEIKGCLSQLGVTAGEPQVTGAYFAHLVFTDSGRVLYCVPPSDELIWRVPRNEAYPCSSANTLEHLHAIGESSRVMQHLQKSGFEVLPLYTRQWERLDQQGRIALLRSLLKLPTEPGTN